MKTENRNSLRLSLDVKVNLSENGFAQSRDISRGGVCLIAGKKMDIGSIVSLAFFLPDNGEEVRAFGKIRWSKSVSEHYYEHGVEFWDIEDDGRKKIEDFFYQN